jgi:hypothetical protein
MRVPWGGGKESSFGLGFLGKSHSGGLISLPSIKTKPPFHEMSMN